MNFLSLSAPKVSLVSNYPKVSHQSVAKNPYPFTPYPSVLGRRDASREGKDKATDMCIYRYIIHIYIYTCIYIYT